jgi:hypothetical protein
MLDDTIVKIVNSKILVQRIVCYFVIDTLALDER